MTDEKTNTVLEVQSVVIGLGSKIINPDDKSDDNEQEKDNG